MSAEYVPVYQLLKAAGCELDNHESDLYVKATPEAVAIVKASGWSHSYFESNIDGLQWLEVPFGFEPWWTVRQAWA